MHNMHAQNKHKPCNNNILPQFVAFLVGYGTKVLCFRCQAEENCNSFGVQPANGAIRLCKDLHGDHLIESYFVGKNGPLPRRILPISMHFGKCQLRKKIRAMFQLIIYLWTPKWMVTAFILNVIYVEADATPPRWKQMETFFV